MIKEIIETMSTRIRSPLFGYYFFLLLAINWKAIFYIFAADVSVKERIIYFETDTDLSSLILIPILFASIGIVAYPWINYFFLNLCKKPTELRNNIQAQSEHALLLKKQELEELRSELLSGKERELIERAKRDQELGEIEDSDIKEKIQSEIEQLRNERDSLSNTTHEETSELDYKHVSDLIKLYNERADLARSQGEYEKSEMYMQKALDLQERLAFKYIDNA